MTAQEHIDAARKAKREEDERIIRKYKPKTYEEFRKAQKLEYEKNKY